MTSSLRSSQERSIQIAAGAASAKAQSDIEVRQKIQQQVAHACLSRYREAPDIRPPQADCLRAQRQRLDRVGATPDAAVEQHVNLAVNRSDALRKRVQRGDRAIHLPPA